MTGVYEILQNSLLLFSFLLVGVSARIVVKYGANTLSSKCYLAAGFLLAVVYFFSN